MCGILFSSRSAPTTPIDVERIERALALMQHRGPDDGNLRTLNDAVIAHRRLSIIDTQASIQPMNDPSGRFFLSYNGEIYNYEALRAELSGRWSFDTKGDTEVLLAGLVLEGQAFIPRLEGMWSFALWDNHKKRLLLSRDRLGKKPLYYSHDKITPQTFTCASELPALKLLLDELPNEDLKSRNDYFRYGFCLPGHTLYDNIKELLPGHNLVFEKGKLVQHQYWSLSHIEEIAELCPKKTQQQLYDAFDAAVKKRLVADVEVGALLSGGIDSSLVVSFAARSMDTALSSFCLGFSEESYDESHFAAEVARNFGTKHHTCSMEESSVSHATRLLIRHFGQPFADPSILPTFAVSRFAAQHLKVVLSGDGGDELFSGYQRYTARTYLRWLSRLPKSVRSNTRKVIKLLPKNDFHHSGSFLKKAQLFFELYDRQEEESPYVAPLYFGSQDRHALLAGDSQTGHTPPSGNRDNEQFDISAMMKNDAAIYLPQDILQKTDRTSMASSLEVRSPFLDHRVVELAYSMPLTWHRSHFTGKQMLKNTFAGDIPENIWKRNKQGFSVPLSQWFKSRLGQELQTRLQDQAHTLNTDTGLKLLDQHRQGTTDQGFRLWMIYCYLVWQESN